MRRHWQVLIPLGLLAADRLQWPLLFRIPLYVMGAVVFAQALRTATRRERWWAVGCVAVAIAAAVAAELTHERTPRLAMAWLFVGALAALVAPILFSLLKALKEVVVVILQTHTMLKDMRAGRWPPRHLDTLTGRSSPPAGPPS